MCGDKVSFMSRICGTVLLYAYISIIKPKRLKITQQFGDVRPIKIRSVGEIYFFL